MPAGHKGPSFPMNTTIESLEQRHMRTDLPQFKAGDTLRVHFKVIEGNLIGKVFMTYWPPQRISFR